MKTIEICLGASGISLAATEVSGTGAISLLTTTSVNHNGKVTGMLHSLPENFAGYQLG